MKNKKVSCIIPAYNEEKTVGGVVKSTLKSPDIHEIIVVNDGSTDKTLEKLKIFEGKIKIIDLPQNKGKGYAVAQGVKVAKYPNLLFFDADLINYENHHFFSLINPVITNRAGMTIAAPSNVKFSNYPFWRLSGQRCLKKKEVEDLTSEMEKTNYGLEVVLNEHFKTKRMIVVPLVFTKKYHYMKQEKEQDWAASYVKELWEIIQKTIAVKSAKYRRQTRKEFLQNISSYLKISYRKAKDYLLEEE